MKIDKPYIKFASAWILLFCIQAAFAQGVQTGRNVGDRGYLLGFGDVIEVTVYGEDDLSMQLKINGDGPVNYAFAGKLSLASKTVATVEQEITELLRDGYLIDPRVSVAVAQYRPFFIVGSIRKPGSYPFQPGMTVRKAISMAGGLEERASSHKWFLVAEGASKDNRHKVRENDPVKPGDTIAIEESFF